MRGHAFHPFGGQQLAVMMGEEPRHDARCFADDVVVDFPSMAPAVDRIRSEFLRDERPMPLPATVTLTRREAATGARVPLDVPVRCICRSCGGRGETWTVSCDACSGSGVEIVRHPLQVSVPGGVSDGDCFYFTVTPRHNPPTRIELRVLVF